MSVWLVSVHSLQALRPATWAETFLKKHEQVIAAQGQANDPVTNEEEIGGFGDDW